MIYDSEKPIELLLPSETARFGVQKRSRLMRHLVVLSSLSLSATAGAVLYWLSL